MLPVVYSWPLRINICVNWLAFWKNWLLISYLFYSRMSNRYKEHFSFSVFWLHLHQCMLTFSYPKSHESSWYVLLLFRVTKKVPVPKKPFYIIKNFLVDYFSHMYSLLFWTYILSEKKVSPMQQITQFKLKWGQAREICVEWTPYQKQDKKDILTLTKYSFWTSDCSLTV